MHYSCMHQNSESYMNSERAHALRACIEFMYEAAKNMSSMKAQSVLYSKSVRRRLYFITPLTYSRIRVVC